jgi:hypothetical protein
MVGSHADRKESKIPVKNLLLLMAVSMNPVTNFLVGYPMSPKCINNANKGLLYKKRDGGIKF